MKLLKHLIVITLICYGQSMLAMDDLHLRKREQSAPEILPIREMNNKLIALMTIEIITQTPLAHTYKNISSDEEFCMIWTMEYSKILPRDIDARLSDTKERILNLDTDDAIEAAIIAFLAWDIRQVVSDDYLKAERLFSRVFSRHCAFLRTPTDLYNFINENIPQDYLDYLIGCYFEYPRRVTDSIDMPADQYFGPQYADYYLAKRAEYMRKKDNPGLRKRH